jgi:hypothetical protein
MWGRWDHRLRLETEGFGFDDIPKIQWDQGSLSNRRARRMLEQCLDAVSNQGGWRGWGSFDNFEYFMEWLLFGFGHRGHRKEPKEPSPHASERLYQLFDLGLLLLAPNDYLGDILAENAHGRHLGFFPTPLNVCEMMAMMTMGDKDLRLEMVCDPCVGTGRMLLAASNYSYQLYGMDINRTVILATLVNGFLFAPWIVAPTKFKEAAEPYGSPIYSDKFSDSMIQAAGINVAAAAYLGAPDETEHDPINQPACEPIKIRRRRVAKPKVA